MSKRGETFCKRKEGRWEARYPKGKDKKGRTKYGYIYAKTYAEAKENLIFAKFDKTAPLAVSKVSYGEILDTWLDRVGVRAKQSTKARYHYIVERYLRPEFGSQRAELLNTIAVESFAHTLLYSGSVDHSPLSVVRFAGRGLWRF